MKTIMCTIALACTTCGFVVWRVHAARSQDVPHFAVLDDQSFSYTGGCLATVGLAEQISNAPNASQGSTLTMLALGDGRSANEPQQLGTYSIPRSRQVIEGAHANARHRQELLLDIWDKCNSAGGISTSPIFLGVKQSIASLRSKGCKESSHCQLLVSSDLEENVEPAIKERLNHRNSKRELPTRLDNRGIGVVFCGFAATAGVIEDASGREIRKATPRNPGREDRIQETWRSLFTSPVGVVFEPYCPKPSNPGLFVSFDKSHQGGAQ